MITSLVLLAALAVPAPAAQIRNVADLPSAPSHPADCAKMPQHKPFALVLTTKTPKVRMGSVPEFAVTITNCSGKALNLTAGFPQAWPLDTSFHLYITDPGGKRIEPAFYHKFLPGELYTGTSLILQKLGPGRAYTQPARHARSWSTADPSGATWRALRSPCNESDPLEIPAQPRRNSPNPPYIEPPLALRVASRENAVACGKTAPRTRTQEEASHAEERIERNPSHSPEDRPHSEFRLRRPPKRGPKSDTLQKLSR